MSGIARIMSAKGAAVSGSDLNDSSSLTGLRTLGITTYVGHAASHIGDATMVIRSSAIPEMNVEIQEALRRGLPILERATALAELLVDKRSVAIAGTHGKTTTTSS